MTGLKPTIASLAVIVAGALALSSCGITTAQQIGVELTNAQSTNASGFSLFSPNAPAHFEPYGTQKRTSGAGETVINLDNDTEQKRQFTLAVTGLVPKSAWRLPRKVVSTSDLNGAPSSVVAVSDVLNAARSGATGGGIGLIDTYTSLHVYIAPGVQYLLFDRLGGYRHGGACVIFEPKPGKRVPKALRRVLC